MDYLNKKSYYFYGEEPDYVYNITTGMDNTLYFSEIIQSQFDQEHHWRVIYSDWIEIRDINFNSLYNKYKDYIN